MVCNTVCVALNTLMNWGTETIFSLHGYLVIRKSKAMEEADKLAKQGSELLIEGPEPFIPFSYASYAYAL